MFRKTGMADEQRRCIKCNAPCRVSAKFCGACGSYLNNGPHNFVQIVARKSAFVQNNQGMQP